MRIVWMSDHPTLNTGYARVTREIVERLAADSEIQIAILGWNGEETLEFSPNCRAMPGGDDFGQARLPSLIDQFQPHLLVALGDPWTLEWLSELDARSRPTTLVYFPLDNSTPPVRWMPFLRNIELLVAYSQFARDLIATIDPALPVHVIYHGVNTEIFHPIRDKARLRRVYAEQAGFDPGLLDGKFIVGCVARNQPRKGLPILIKAFARFVKCHPDALLVLHTAAHDQGWDLPALLDMYGLQDCCLVSDSNHPHRGVSDMALNMIYNLFDVFVLPTMAEGFGLPLVEAMACGVPVVATDCSAVTELVRGRGDLIRVKEWITVGEFNAEHALPDIDHLVQLLQRLYEEPERRAEYAACGRAFAETLSWDRIVAEWRVLLAGTDSLRNRSRPTEGPARVTRQPAPSERLDLARVIPSVPTTDGIQPLLPLLAPAP